MSLGLASWVETWTQLGAAAADEGLYDRAIACWGEPHRHYHTLQHLRECLAQFEAVRDRARRPAEVALALWFHDVIYDPRRTDNEARSAQWARDSVMQAGLPAAVAQRVHELVMATRHHEPPADADAQLLVDVDLSILGADTARFDESDRQIRSEYAHMSDEDYRAGRMRVLAGFLARPRLYTTEFFHAAFEKAARQNLQRALDRLSA
jgi:predicted metal-dependent HD superfamily phosphohydrolase